METKISRTTSLSSAIGARPARPLGERSQGDERSFVLPRRSDQEGDDEEETTGEDSGLLSPQPRRDASAAVYRVRLEDEVGQQIDLRG